MTKIILQTLGVTRLKEYGFVLGSCTPPFPKEAILNGNYHAGLVRTTDFLIICTNLEGPETAPEVEFLNSSTQNSHLF